MPLLVRSGVFFFFFCLVGADSWCVFRPLFFLEEEISDYIAHGPMIRVLTVVSWLVECERDSERE